MAPSAIVVAKQSFAATINGTSRVIRRGTTFSADHPIVEAHSENFKPFEVDYGIEQATAAPGEKRSTKIRGRGKPETTEPDKSTEEE